MAKASHTIVLRNDDLRAEAAQLIYRAPPETHVTFRRGEKRTVSQNSLLWPLLTAISKGVEWYGKHYSAEDWKLILSASLRGYEAVPGIDPGRMVVLGQSTSKMDKETFSDLLELVLAFGAQQGVDLTDPRQEQAA